MNTPPDDIASRTATFMRVIAIALAVIAAILMVGYQ
jgi:hypothetical protein